MLDSLLPLTGLMLAGLTVHSACEGVNKCDPLTSHKLDIICFAGEYPITCSEPVPGNTTARFRCKSWTKTLKVPEYNRIVCNNGVWDRPLMDDFCEIECGKTSSDLDNLEESSRANRSEPFPWHAAIYKLNSDVSDFEYKCSGTLVSKKVVLTSVYCVSSKSDDWSSVMVAVGKRYPSLNVSEIETAQVRDVVTIFNDQWNLISLLELKSEVDYSHAVRPVCIKSRPLLGTPRNYSFLENTHREGADTTARFPVSGEFSGWDADCDFDPKGIIKPSNMNISCRLGLLYAPTFCTDDRYETFLDLKNSVACRRYEGTGLVNKDPASNSYYLDAVIGKWKKDANYNMDIHLIDAEYIGPYLDADLTCDPIDPDKFTSLEINCAKGVNILDCNSRMPNGATVKFQCNPYSTIQVAPQPYVEIRCRENGYWDKPILDSFCRLSCGIPLSNTDEHVTYNGTNYSPFPWHAGIYERDNGENDYKYVCGGTLLSNRVVVTSASCVMTWRLADSSADPYEVKDVRKIKVAVGKFYRELNDTRDHLAQSRDVESMEVGSGYNKNYGQEDDIAVLILTQDFVYSYAVRPVCVDFKSSQFENLQLTKTTGKIIGWGRPGNCERETDELRLIKSHLSYGVCHEKQDTQTCGSLNPFNGLCSGFEGGGQVFKDGNTETYVLRGVVSTYSSAYATFTKLSGYKSYIEGPLSSETCSPVTSKKLTITCRRGGDVLSCEDVQPNGAQVMFHCNNETAFQVKPQRYNVITCGSGQWNQPLVDDFCLEECGRLATEADLPPGVEDQLRMYPWHAGIYRAKGIHSVQTCSGSLVSERVVVTAAQCFVDKITGRKTPEAEKNYEVTLGNYYRDLRDERDHYQQIHTIKAIRIADNYQGLSSQFANDIAIVILSKPVKFNHAVRPVCVITDNEDLPDDAITQVPGWGLAFKLNEHLRWSNISYVPRQECLEQSSSRFGTYITQDKICGANAENIVITCPEDNGGGLIFHKDGRYYLLGVLSMKADNECVGRQYGLFTRTSKHKDTIEFSADCKMPAQPANGEYEIDSTNTTARVLKFQCSPGFNIIGQDTVRCDDGFWNPELPTCSDGCPSLSSTKLKLKCSLEGHPVPCNSTLKKGAEVSFKCWSPAYIRSRFVSYNHVTCDGGKWSMPLPEDSCIAVCGVIGSNEVVPVIGHGYFPNYGEFPWHAAIYEKLDDRWILNCGGSIISSRVVITAAHCLARPWGQVKSYTSYMIALGKHYSDLNAPQDQEHAQLKYVSRVIIPEGYSGSTTFFNEDYGFLVLKDPVVFNAYVNQVCIDVSDDNFEAEQLVSGSLGKVPGYGMTENGTLSSVLKAAELPYMNPGECKKNIDSNIKSNVIDDKLCAGNESSDATVCKGDSGGGLVFYHKETNAYFLRGVLSQGGKFCTTSKIGIFTKVSRYAEVVNCFVHARNLDPKDGDRFDCSDKGLSWS